ncbi:MAG: hypothetical protein GQ529_08430 [Methyloprofundus sp.]|nr:hypothetical protein [Methyloprofundus sp.]
MVLENHLHLIASSREHSKRIQPFKSFTARQVLDLLKQRGATTLLKYFASLNVSIQLKVNISFGRKVRIQKNSGLEIIDNWLLDSPGDTDGVDTILNEMKSVVTGLIEQDEIKADLDTLEF